MVWSLLLWMELRLRHFLIVGTALLLSGIGLFFIVSTCYAGEFFRMDDAWLGQSMWLGFAVAAAAVCAVTDYRKHGLLLGLAYAVLIVLLLVTLRYGVELNGARRSLRFLGLSFQPGIPARLVTVLVFSLWCARPPVQLGLVLRIVVGFLIVAIPVCLIAKQPAYGNASVLAVACLLVLLVHCARANFMKYLVLAGVAGFVFLGPLLGWVRRQELSEKDIVAALPGWVPAHHVKRYVPFLQRRGGRGNEQQIDLCFRSGGLLGKGWQQGDLQTGGFLPHGVAGSDYILATVAEEAGLLGCVTVLALCAALLVLCLRVAAESTDDWGRLLCVGVASVFALQVVVSAGMALRLFPIVGLTIPMLGRGGTILVAAYMGIGLVASVQRHSVPLGERKAEVAMADGPARQQGVGEGDGDDTVAIDLLPYGPLRILLTLRREGARKALVAKAKDTLGLQLAPLRHPVRRQKALRKVKQYTRGTNELPGFREASMPPGAIGRQPGIDTASSADAGQAGVGLS